MHNVEIICSRTVGVVGQYTVQDTIRENPYVDEYSFKMRGYGFSCGKCTASFEKRSVTKTTGWLPDAFLGNGLSISMARNCNGPAAMRT